MAQSVDDLIGRVRAELEAAGVADNTYLVFSSDNGFHLGEHALRAGKLTAYDHDIRVPLIVVPLADRHHEPSPSSPRTPTCCRPSSTWPVHRCSRGRSTAEVWPRSSVATTRVSGERVRSSSSPAK